MSVAVLAPNDDLFWLSYEAPYIVPPGTGINSPVMLGWQAASDGSDGTHPNVGEWIFGLTTFTIPPAGIVRSVQVVTRGFNLNNPFPVTMLAEVGTGYPVFSVLASLTLTYPNMAVVDRVSATSAIVADQTTVDALSVHLRRVVIGDMIAVTKLALNVIYAAVPVVVVGPPAGTIVQASPTQTWTYSGDIDADGGGVQQRYHIKTFDAATYGAVGFDPATSTAAYDSGEVMSSATGAIIGPFVNLTTFKTWIRVAQNVNGAPHWSLWDDGAEFTTDTDPPQVATITATPLAASVRVRVTRDLAHTDWTHINLERSDDAGVTWRPVRGALEPAAPADTVIVYDYEQPEGIPLRYRARGVIKDGVTVLSQGDWKATSSPVTWTTAEPCGEWLRAPGDPAGACLIEPVVDEQTTTTQHRVGVLDVIGRASPVTVWDTPSLAVGMLATVTRTYAEGNALRDLVRSAPVLLWQGRRAWGHPHRWLVVTDHSVSRPATADSTVTEHRTWEITYVEVSEPPVLT